ncbi:hypothetical protein HYPSUDRAFT_31645 [Hypholoma sublateritium FD-334 SS-4]|uniref:Uncharacterized protein n=1 Tax=Hypholoma sublateritium (strain FD-334 SS-4) TaxID=945553 RepID=A0A0D2MZW7_HYPSF|nr:hypothetical protein HYPSUDRAFT_31645 [Hypholoma sublateritium FD-334 SS-4]
MKRNMREQLQVYVFSVSGGLWLSTGSIISTASKLKADGILMHVWIYALRIECIDSAQPAPKAPVK